MPDFSEEKKINGIVAGLDEVGCGPWAGPLLSVACVIKQDIFPSYILELIDDSKKLTKKKREYIYKHLQEEKEHSIFWGSGLINIDEFNDMGLKLALAKSMQCSIDVLSLKPCHVLIDGIRNPNLPIPSTLIKKGDSKSFSIAAASIIAKVERDSMMEILHQEFPYYGWADNAGYGTKKHQEAIIKYGISKHHRTCYAPIRRFLEGQKSC